MEKAKAFRKDGATFFRQLFVMAVAAVVVVAVVAVVVRPFL
jgi:hypothetical protein